MVRPSVLIIDDERNFREFLGEALETVGYDVALAASARSGLALARERAPKVVLLDQNLPDQPGLDLLPLLRQTEARPAVIMVTAYAEYSRAVAAVKAGAHHYLTKPFEFADLLQILDDLKILLNGLVPNANDDALSSLVGISPAMQDLERQLWQVATSPVATVLIRGESGTGKELIARAIHALSERARNRMLSVNCAAFTETLLMSELFGHERGAFTDARHQKKGVFENAQGGTLFLDEISEMVPQAQAALLRVLEERVVTRVGGSVEIPVDVRIVAASNRPLERQVDEAKFRADLYYRLNVVEIMVPPLRERPEDIPVLVRHFARLFARQYGVAVRELSPEVEALLIGYPWPGNVRELRNTIERAYVMGRGPEIQLGDLPLGLRHPALEDLRTHTALHKLPFREAKRKTVDHFERTYLTRALARSRGNVSRAARRAGMPRQVLQRLLQRHDLKGADFRR
jgi:two-component system response regulator AtoC